MSPVGATTRSQPAQARLEILHSPDCPHVDQARALLRDCLAELQLETPIRDREGVFPSPTILVNGVDVMGRTDMHGEMCRLDPPTREQGLAALTR